MASHDGGDVSDSTDWLGTSLACLMPVEAAFRCHVCKDFYNSPMITSCNHSFCSLCIRRCLSVEGKCPVCRASDQESKLRGNWALRDAVDSFCKARSTVLACARAPAVPPPQPTKRKPGDDGTAADTAGSQEEPRPKRTRTSTRLSKTRAAEAVTAIALDEEGEGEAEVVEVANPRGSHGGDADTDYKPDDGLIECPICQRRIKMTMINTHLDNNCSPMPSDSKSSTPALSRTTGPTTFKPLFSGSAPAKAPERLPSISYSLLTDTALRKKMSSLGLSTTGPRLLLERRHREWSTIWNANCDSARPKRKQELLRDLDVWERTVGALVVLGGMGGSGAGAAGGTGRGTSALTSRPMVAATHQAAMIKDKNFDASAWKEKHNTSFQDLIANARRSRSKAHEPKKENDSGNEDTAAQHGAGGLKNGADSVGTAPQASERPFSEDAGMPTSIPDSNPATPTSEGSDGTPAEPAEPAGSAGSAGSGEATEDVQPPQTEYEAPRNSGRSDTMVVEL